MTENRPVFRELGVRWKHAYDRPWSLKYLLRGREGGTVMVAELLFEDVKEIVVTNGHVMAEMSYLSRCVPRLDKVLLKAYADGEFPTSFGDKIRDADTWSRNISGMRQYFTEFGEKGIPIDDTNVLVHFSDEESEINPVAVLRYRLGSSTGLDIPRYVAVDPSYHYMLRSKATAFRYNADYSTVFYYESAHQPRPSAMLATMTPVLCDKVQKHLDQMSMFLPEKE